MSIKGLTDRPAAFPEIGAVRKGAPKGDKQPGADLKHFRVEIDEREQDSAKAFLTSYGETPTELTILFPFDDLERNFETWKEAYVSGALLHRCDGERVIYEIKHSTGERLVTNGQPYKLCDGQARCKPVGRMKVLIPELRRLAYLTVHTTSVHDIINLSSQLEAIRVINGGRLAGIPLKLRRRPQKISMPGPNGKRVRREKSLLSVEADPEWVKAKLLDMKRSALPGNGIDLGPALLPEPEAGHNESGDDWTTGTIDAGDDDDDERSLDNPPSPAPASTPAEEIDQALGRAPAPAPEPSREAAPSHAGLVAYADSLGITRAGMREIFAEHGIKGYRAERHDELKEILRKAVDPA